MTEKIKTHYKKHKCFIFIILFGIIIRIVWIVVIAANQWYVLSGDTCGYIDNAQSIINEGHLIYDGLRTPGYPLIIAFFMLISKTHYYLLVCVLQNILNLIAICAVFQIISILLNNNKAACIGGLIAIFNYHDIYYDNLILSDSVAQSLQTISLLFFVMFIKKEVQKTKEKMIYISIGSALLAYALLVRPSLIFLPFTCILGFVLVEVFKKEYKWIIPTILIISIVCYSPVYCWTIRNKNYANYNGYSTVSSINLYCYNSAAVYAEQNNMDYNETVVFLKEGKDKEYQEYLKCMDKFEAMNKRAKEIIFSDILCYTKRCAIDIGALIIYPGVLSFESIKDSFDNVIPKVKNQGIFVIFNESFQVNAISLLIVVLDCLVLFVLFVFSIIGSVKLLKKCRIPALLLIGTELYNIAICCQPVGFGAYPRFRLSYSMIIIILVACSFGIKTFFKRNQNI